MTETTIYVMFGLLALAIVGLLLLFLKVNSKIEETAKDSIIKSKTHTNNRYDDLDKKTPKIRVQENNEVYLLAADGKTEIGLIGNLPTNNTQK